MGGLTGAMIDLEMTGCIYSRMSTIEAKIWVEVKHLGKRQG